ncbi:MAG TPA: polysaccharide deacetylase family protein [Burkholderiales bacterium]|nr:polysaccharide deacetylase family protein [Burkholderiales bacterium]
MSLERDFVGYGMTPPAVAWPGGARIAVQVAVNYEEGAEYSLLDGDAHREPTGDLASPVPLDQRDLMNESFFEYGSRVGVWRLLDLLDKQQIKGTFLACGLALERNPQVAREIVRRGHEPAGHGYRWEEHHKMSRDEEREAIRKAVDSVSRTTGERPVGWMPRYGPSVNTRELLVEEGGFVYDSCHAINDDLPYRATVNGRRWLVVPYAGDVNDGRAFRGGGGGPDDFYNVMRYTFDVLYAEGAARPKMMTVALHCRISGRPAFAHVVGRFLTYARQFPDVWFARRIDIARWWLERGY